MATPMQPRDRSAAERWGGRAGLTIGVLAAVALVVAFRIPAGDELPGATVEIAVSPTGELAVTPKGVLLRADDLHPGAVATGRVTVTNLTGVARAVSLRATTAGRELETSLRVDVAAGDQTVFSGTLKTLRSRGTPALNFAAGERRLLVVRVSLSDGASGTAGRGTDIDLRLATASVERP
jgi:hypothetical protein